MARTTRTAATAEATDAAPVSGTVTDPQPTTIIPSVAEQNAASERARGRTMQQVGVPGATVIVLAWLLRLFGIDLNPIPGNEDMPPEVVAAAIVIATQLLANRMNPVNNGEDSNEA